ncbi:uncharacterized protein LOC132557185 [Ylistrum balloti]|uniref:uncharacterized protein LOC132557185 n=1 Tax=Ylistrum balloti TaxID=509963 RepID=UPI002905AAE1|nr:uncharacterized protein LOC132557185 [Ylistrum balloti]
MATKVSAVGLFILLLPCSLSEDRLIYIGKVVDALERLVNYYKLNYEDLNVDGLFGLRVVEANNSAVEYVQKDDEEYFQKLRFVVGKPWEFLKKHKELKNQLRWHPDLYLRRRKTKLNEDVSDRCMAELMGTNSNSKTTCEISDFCIQMMTTTGLSGYGITHQLLWTVLAEQHGCRSTLNGMLTEKGQRSLEDYREEFCANNFYEMTDLHLHGIITPKYQDLFLEQQFVCPRKGCLAHKTAVAAGALVMYLRYLIDPGPMDIQRKIIDPSQHRFLMSREVVRHQSVTNASLLGEDEDKGHLVRDERLMKSFKAGIADAGHVINGNAPKLGIEEDYEEIEEQNNQAQLNLNNEEGDGNYYAHNGNEEEGYDEKNKEGVQDQNKDKQHMQVQFDRGPVVNADIGHKDVRDGYEEEGYKDNNHNENEDGDYDEEKALNNFKNDVNHIQIGRKPVIPKADETDYTYYDEKEQHNGYNNFNNFDEEEGDVAETKKKVLQPVQVLEDKVERIKKETLSVDTLAHVNNSTSPPNTLFLVVCASMLLVVFFMYRFIRSRRVHIRYHPRPFVRL